MSLLDKIIGILVPHDCLQCGVEGSLLCQKCLADLPAIPPKPINSRYLDTVESVTEYNKVAKELVWQLKSFGAQEAARLMAKAMSKFLPHGNCFVVPIPTASSRSRQRGYDQGKLLARNLSKFGQAVYLDCLSRSGQAHQVGSNREQRLQQLNSALRLKSPLMIRSAHIILIDEVVTTGASIEAAAKLLAQAGAIQIDAITFARPLFLKDEVTSKAIS